MHVQLNKILLSVAFIGLSACNGGGGGGGKPDQPAAVPAAPERIYAMSWNNQQDQNNYCDLTTVSGTTRAVTCYSVQFQGQPACASPTITFTDVTSLCTQIQQTQMGCAWNAAQALIQQRCSGVPVNQIPPTPGVPGGQLPDLPVPTDPNMKLFKCEFEARRVKDRGWFNRHVGTGKLVAQIIVDGSMRQEIDLRRRFLGIDIGSFGKTKMVYTPANLTKNMSDTLTLENRGLNGEITMSQSGFAGLPVKLDAQNDEGTLSYRVSCVGRSAFKKATAYKPYKQLVCRGVSNLTSRTEKIEKAFAYNASLLNGEIELAEGLTMDVSGDTAGQDNARISLRVSARSSDISFLSSAYLKSASQLKIRDSYSDVDVTCYPTY